MADALRADQDRRFMAVALRLAKRGLGRTAPNPSVGALIVDEATGEVIARGWTRPGGRPHAETEALARAGPRARGATMYVTLEPCSHYGQTPPCVEAIVAAGIRRVVVAIADPDPRVAGRGLEGLRAAGVEVERRVASEEADWAARGHILRVTERRPFIQLKLALAADGSAPRGLGGAPVWATSAEARARGHLLRARTDAILVGRRTVEDDDPELTCRLPGLAARSPVRVVLAGDLQLGLDRKLIQTAREVPVWVFCRPSADAARRASLEQRGCHVVPVRDVGGALWLPAVAEELVARGITRLLVEGGATVWRAFSRAALIDEVVLFHARPPDGARVTPDAALATLERYLPEARPRFSAQRPAGSDDMLVFRSAPRLHSERAG
jgi:diaminohydroxyphosphoribosylaminopyrimidine deaminase/5-amino-6-(5-phosphoribosylamino)uracil reductase